MWCAHYAICIRKYEIALASHILFPVTSCFRFLWLNFHKMSRFEATRRVFYSKSTATRIRALHTGFRVIHDHDYGQFTFAGINSVNWEKLLFIDFWNWLLYRPHKPRVDIFEPSKNKLNNNQHNRSLYHVSNRFANRSLIRFRASSVYNAA